MWAKWVPERLRADPTPQKAMGTECWKQKHTKLGTTCTVRERRDLDRTVTLSVIINKVEEQKSRGRIMR